MTIPSREECLSILIKNKTPSNVIEHCKAVCRVAEEIAGNLIKKGIVDFNIKHESPTYLTGEMVSVMDNMREKIAKPVYRSMPVNFKNWYDKVRYRA